jgi:hypothetical protein
VMRGDAPTPSRLAFATMKTRDARECYNYGDVGHIVRDCPKPFKSNCGRGRGGIRGAARGGRGCGGRSDYRANAVGTEEEISLSSESISVELEESKKVRERNQDQEIHYGDFINFAHMNEGSYANTSCQTQISQLK